MNVGLHKEEYERTNVQGEGREPLCGEASLSTEVLAQHAASYGSNKSRTVTSALLIMNVVAEAYRDITAKALNIAATRNATQSAITGVAMMAYALSGNITAKYVHAMNQAKCFSALSQAIDPSWQSTHPRSPLSPKLLGSRRSAITVIPSSILGLPGAQTSKNRFPSASNPKQFPLGGNRRVKVTL